MKMKQPDKLLFDLQNIIIRLSLVDRNHYLAGTARRENDSEHTLSVAFLCWRIYEAHNISDLDISKILKYAMAHDLVEVYAGDVNTFATKEEREQKLVLEQQALKRLSREFSDFEGMVKAMQDYENKVDDEALFVWTVDKMQALIMGDLDKWRPYKELDISYQEFCRKYSETLELASPYCQQIFNELFEYCKTTYYDRAR